MLLQTCKKKTQQAFHEDERNSTQLCDQKKLWLKRVDLLSILRYMPLLDESSSKSLFLKDNLSVSCSKIVSNIEKKFYNEHRLYSSGSSLYVEEGDAHTPIAINHCTPIKIHRLYLRSSWSGLLKNIRRWLPEAATSLKSEVVESAAIELGLSIRLFAKFTKYYIILLKL